MSLNPVTLFNVEDPFKCIIEKRVNRFVAVVTAKVRALNYKVVKRNVKVGGSLIDYLLLKSDSKAYLEIKSAVLRGDGTYGVG